MEFAETGQWAQAKGGARPASELIDGAPRLAARVPEVDGIGSFLSSPLFLRF